MSASLRRLAAVGSGLILALASVAGCDANRPPAPDVKGYRQSVSDSVGLVATYRAQATTQPASGCQAALATYSGQLEAQLQKMQGMSGGMDACMQAMGMSGGMMSMCSNMTRELSRHRAVACAGSEADQHAEALRHCNAMDAMLNELGAQAAAMAGMMGGASPGGTTGGGGAGGMMGGGMMGGMGTTSSGGMMDAGGTTGGGGMMGGGMMGGGCGP